VVMAHHTSQRTAIRRVLEEADRPLGPAEIHSSAQAYVPGLGLTTVYRTVKSLVEDEWLVAVDLPGEPCRYELAGKPHHHHFRCRTCACVFEVMGCPGAVDALAPEGFLVESHDLILFGLCPDCHDS